LFYGIFIDMKKVIKLTETQLTNLINKIVNEQSDDNVSRFDSEINVEDWVEISEKWTQKYKKSIDCSNPKGFSQRAHCQGRKKRK
jgi:hypothetical protein